MSAKNLKNRAAKPVRKPAKAPVRTAAKATSKAKPKAAAAAAAKKSGSGSKPAKTSSGTKSRSAAAKGAGKAVRGATKVTSPTRPKAGKTVPKSALAPRKTVAAKATPAARAKAPVLTPKITPQGASKTPKTPAVTAKKNPAPEVSKDAKSSKPAAPKAAPQSEETPKTAAPETAVAAKAAPAPKAKASRTTLDDLALDIDEKDELLEQEKRDLAKALRDDEDEPLETAFIPTDTSERFILVVDEEGQRRNETVTIVQQILPNAVIEVADDPEEALEVMEEADFDTYVVNFLMPGYSASPFVKAVANHPDHPLLIGFAADKISDALDQRKGLKIIPLKRLFDLDVSPAEAAAAKEKAAAED